MLREYEKQHRHQVTVGLRCATVHYLSTKSLVEVGR